MEDIGPGDLTSRYFVAAEYRSARIFSKEPAVAAGVETAAEVFHRVDPGIEVKIVQDGSGSRLEKGESVMKIRGSETASILTGERVALNFIQRLSGIATLTRRFVDAAAGHKARILDTRKTTPGLRALEKAAVVAGGGMNHRFGLYDMVMVKDNHLAGMRLDNLQRVIQRFRQEKPGFRLELEADTLDQVRRFLTLMGVDVILLDNMRPAEMAEAVRLGGGKVQFEASGGITLAGIAEIAATGVDFISVGALTHSARAVDFLAGIAGTGGEMTNEQTAMGARGLSADE